MKGGGDIIFTEFAGWIRPGTKQLHRLGLGGGSKGDKAHARFAGPIRHSCRKDYIFPANFGAIFNLFLFFDAQNFL